MPVGRGECRRGVESVACLADRAGAENGKRFEILAPLLELRKTQVVRLGMELGAPLELTLSCYDPTPAGLSCAHCDACQLRRKGFAEAGVEDPIPYLQEAQ